jgi:hypothetical protein
MSTKAHNFETYTKNLFKELNSKFQIKQESKKLFNDIICKIIKDIIIDYIMSLKDCKTIHNSNILEIFEDTSYFTEETMVIIKSYVNEKLDNYEKYQSELEKNDTQSKMKLEKHVKLIFPITKTENIIRKELKDVMNKSPRFDKRSGVFISITAIIQCLIEILITKSCDFTKEQNKVQVSAEYICKTIENNTDYDSLYGSYTYEEKITKLSKQKTLASNSDKKCVKNKKSSSDDESADESDAEFESNSKTKSVKKTVKKTVKKQINKDDVTSENENSDSDSKDKSCSKIKTTKKPLVKKKTKQDAVKHENSDSNDNSDGNSNDNSDGDSDGDSKTKSVKKTVKKTVKKPVKKTVKKPVKKTVKKQTDEDDVTGENENSDSDSKDKSCSKTKPTKKPFVKKKTKQDAVKHEKSDSNDNSDGDSNDNSDGDSNDNSDGDSDGNSDDNSDGNSKTKPVKKPVKKQTDKDSVTNEKSDSDSKYKSCSKTKPVKKQIKNSEMPITKKETTTIFDPPLLNSKESTINQVVYNSSESDNDNEYSDVSD